MNNKKLATALGLAMICLCQPATAWAASFEEQELIWGLTGGVILGTLIILGAVFIRRKSKQEQLTAMAQLKTTDPAFNEQEFLTGVSALFFEIKHAWTNRDMELVRAVMSNDVFSRFALQLQKHVRDGTFNRLDELSINPPAIGVIKADANYNRIGVLITFKAKDYIVDERGRKVSGSTNFTTKIEQWSFMRPLKAATTRKDGTPSTKCPACGAPAPASPAAECENCHSKANKRDFDWILSGISEIDPDKGNIIDALLSVDP
jgi:hypothetical protein